MFWVNAQFEANILYLPVTLGLLDGFDDLYFCEFGLFHR
jgi:hypothetical protein